MKQDLQNDLASLRQEDEFNSSIAIRPFLSSVLDNEIAQAVERGGDLTHEALSVPIRNRRHLLISPGGPLEHLQIRAYSLAIQTHTLIGGSAALSYLAFLSERCSVATSASATLLASVFAAYRLQGAWLKAQKRFFQNYDRIESNLGHDLQVGLPDLLSFWLIPATGGCDGSSFETDICS